jgi:demethylmenaquinone methyltransferase/2-methoxy-6-polyprenyl-1,4-benzoquinol methylase
MVGMQVHFGYRMVSPEEKVRLVLRHFNTVARKYDFMNTVLSFGMHLLWKRRAVRMLGPQRGDRVLDLCGGTGDLSILAAKETGPSGRVILCDMNPAMMESGRRKLGRNAVEGPIELVRGDAELLGFRSGQFDAVMVGFGIRNLTHMEKGLEEIFRVLKPGGSFMCLEFSRPVTAWFRRLYDLYSFHIMPLAGKILAGSREAYTYLPESIRVFPGPEELKEILERVGFEGVKYRRFTDGIAVVHTGRRP